MQKPVDVAFTELTREQCRALVQRNHIGRIAYTLHDRVEIEPISYVAEGEWIFMRTSEGSKLEKLRHHPWAAFQVDEIRSHIDWKSTVVHGHIQNISADQSPVARDALAAAIAVLQTVDPHAFTPMDTAPHRDQVLRLHLDDITGKQAVPALR